MCLLSHELTRLEEMGKERKSREWKGEEKGEKGRVRETGKGREKKEEKGRGMGKPFFLLHKNNMDRRSIIV